MFQITGMVQEMKYMDPEITCLKFAVIDYEMASSVSKSYTPKQVRYADYITFMVPDDGNYYYLHHYITPDKVRARWYGPGEESSLLRLIDHHINIVKYLYIQQISARDKWE